MVAREGTAGAHLTSSAYPFYMAGPQDFATIYFDQPSLEGVGLWYGRDSAVAP